MLWTPFAAISHGNEKGEAASVERSFRYCSPLPLQLRSNSSAVARPHIWHFDSMGSHSQESAWDVIRQLLAHVVSHTLIFRCN